MPTRCVRPISTARSLAPLFAVLLAFLMMVLSPGCTSLAEVSAFRADAAAARDRLAEEADRLGAIASALPPEGDASHDPAASAAADAAASRAAELRGALASAVDRLDSAIAEAASPTDSLTVLSRSAGEFVPPPYRLPLVLAAALVATGVRARALKRGAVSIAKSLDAAMARSPVLAEAFAAESATVRSVQTPTAARVVDESDASRRLVRLPI